MKPVYVRSKHIFLVKKSWFDFISFKLLKYLYFINTCNKENKSKTLSKYNKSCDIWKPTKLLP